MQPMQFGEWKVRSCVAGRFGLDGGAMFGVVPRTMWGRVLPPDELNRVPMVMRVLLVEGHGRRIIVDVGAGGGHSEKNRQIYAFEDTDHLLDVIRDAGMDPAAITDVMLTHLHFDHGAGVAEPHGDGWRLLFPQARHHVQRTQWEHALRPNARDRASYYEERIRILETERVLDLHDGEWSLGPGFDLLVFNGHTPGQQLPLIRGPQGALFFCGDLFPFHHHLPPPWVMSYDLLPVTAMEEKSGILERAADEGWTFFFEHDAYMQSCRIVRDGRRFAAAETVAG
ncbi:MAG TPA: MBL fold metallo-hydrolase [Candidatus Krumholzibacteria bacterium]|nr:MBL fold metallo-hydrolase [Candidatus Krumholzibacteria bacterium]